MRNRNTVGPGIGIPVGAKHSFRNTEQERIIDPTGVLASGNRSGGLNAEEQAAFSEWKRKVESDEIVIEYP